MGGNYWREFGRGNPLVSQIHQYYQLLTWIENTSTAQMDISKRTLK
jgi:hypothetical protein